MNRHVLYAAATLFALCFFFQLAVLAINSCGFRGAYGSAHFWHMLNKECPDGKG